MKTLKGKVLVLKVSSKAVKQPSSKIESGKTRVFFLKKGSQLKLPVTKLVSLRLMTMKLYKIYKKEMLQTWSSLSKLCFC